MVLWRLRDGGVTYEGGWQEEQPGLPALRGGGPGQAALLAIERFRISAW